MAAPIIEVRNLTKTFGDKTVVDQLDMTIEEGQLYGFLGPNGSGKTTAIRMMCGLVPLTSGSGTCLGFDIGKQAHKIKPLLGYMTQHFSLYRDLTVRENLQFVCKLYGIKDEKGRVNELVKQFAFDAEGRDRQRVGTMSGGWKQRLALACAMAHRPRILLLDEPTAGVDPKAREAFWDILQDIAATGVSVLVSTHYMDEAMRSQRIAYVLYGRLLVDDAPERCWPTRTSWPHKCPWARCSATRRWRTTRAWCACPCRATASAWWRARTRTSALGRATWRPTACRPAIPAPSTWASKTSFST